MEFNFERDVYMYGEVNTNSVFRVIERLNLLNRYDEEMLKNGPRSFNPQPIILHINSGGGSDENERDKSLFGYAVFV